jgi:hypothetical protein
MSCLTSTQKATSSLHEYNKMGADDDVHRPLGVCHSREPFSLCPPRPRKKRQEKRGQGATVYARARASTTARVNTSRPCYHAQSHNAHQPVDTLPGVTTQQVNASLRTHARQSLPMEGNTKAQSTATAHAATATYWASTSGCLETTNLHICGGHFTASFGQAALIQTPTTRLAFNNSSEQT